MQKQIEKGGFFKHHNAGGYADVGPCNNLYGDTERGKQWG